MRIHHSSSWLLFLSTTFHDGRSRQNGEGRENNKEHRDVTTFSLRWRHVALQKWVWTTWCQMGRGNSVNGFWCAPFVSVSVSGLRDNGSMTSAAYSHSLSLSLPSPFSLSPIEEETARSRESSFRAYIEKNDPSVDEKTRCEVLNRIDFYDL